MEWALSYCVENIIEGTTQKYLCRSWHESHQRNSIWKSEFDINVFQFATLTMEKYYVNRLLDVAHSRYRPGIALGYNIVNYHKNTKG